MFLHGCCNKCDCDCGVLPHTITASFLSFDKKMAYDGGAFFGYSALSCGGLFGSGAMVRIASPGGDLADAGPVTDAYVSQPGSCYAELGRVPPTLSITSSSPKADFDVTLEEFTSQCRPAWKVSSISVTNGGDLKNGESLSILQAFGDTKVVSATAKVVANGDGESVTVTTPGEYYRIAKRDRDVPSLKASSDYGIRLGVDFAYNGGEPPTWSVGAMSILYAGENIEETQLGVTFTTGESTTEETKAVAYVEVEDGKAVSVYIESRGLYFRDTDVPPIVADVTFQPSGSPGVKSGAGAILRGIVDDDRVSETFGQVIDVEIEEPGDGYLGWRWTPERCIDSLNGRSVVLRASSHTPLVRTCQDACFGSGAVIEPCFRVEPVLVGSVEGVGPVAAVYVSKNKGYPETWSVSRVEQYQSAGPIFEVGQQIAVSFAVPLPVNPSDFYAVQYANSDTVERTKQDVAAVVEVSEITTVDPEAGYPPGWETGWLKSVTISEPGQYYQESTTWDGVATPIHHVRLLRRGAGYAKKGRIAPTLSAGASSEMAVTLAAREDSCAVPYWEVDSIELSGSGYTEGSALKITATGVVESAARVVVHTREEPAVSASAAGGSGSLSVTLEKTAPKVSGWNEITNAPAGVQSAIWSVSGVKIDSAGEGYPPNSQVKITFSTADSGSGATATAATDSAGGLFYATVTNGGSYFRNQGVPQEVTFVRRGVYYEEDDSLEPYVGLDGINVIQTAPSSGSGAAVSAVVETDTASANFGKIVSAAVEEPGSGYLMRSGPTDCKYSAYCPEAAQLIAATVGGGVVKVRLSRPVISSDAPGPVEDTDETRWEGYFVSDEAVSDCSEMPAGQYVSAYGGVSGALTLAAGGKFDPKDGCCYCPCRITPRPLDLVPCGIESITVEVDVQVAPDENDFDRCPNLNATLSLGPEAGDSNDGFWVRTRLGDRWSVFAALECPLAVKGRHQLVFSISPLVREPDSPTECGIGADLFDEAVSRTVYLPTSRNEAGDRCCPEGTEFTIEHYDATITVTVTVVEAGE